MFDQVKACFNNFDSNSDGHISMVEFTEVIALKLKTNGKVILKSWETPIFPVGGG